MEYRDVIFPEIMIKNNPHYVENQKDQAATRFKDLGIATDNWDEIREKLGRIIEKIIKKVSSDQEFLSITPDEFERRYQGDVPAGQYDAATIITDLIVAFTSPTEMPFFLQSKGEEEKLQFIARMIVRKRENLKKAKAKERKSPPPAGDVFHTGAEEPPVTRAGTTQIDEGAWDKPQHAVIMEAPRRRIKIKIKGEK